MKPSLAATGLAALWLAACAQTPARDLPTLLARTSPTPLLLVGEQHDAPEHQQLQRELVQALATRGELAAVVMEMAEAGRDTRQLPRDASEDAVRQALAWDQGATWPWPVYGPVVMAAVRAGVPVLGGNLPRARMREAMADTALDRSVDASVLDRQRTAVREGHCDLLPDSQIAPMTRIQLARDRSLADTALQALAPGRTVLLIAGNGHVRTDIGVPLHLPAGQARRVVVARAGSAGADASGDVVWPTPALPERDHCAGLRERFKR
ncbi:hypothetical protein DY262_13895 [Hydrogenophaga borbori]|uniref:Haem-binding uptake Tiki superfamily ChaN domain-containing protein n=1 Tax=Hydrogenophaga borbori TaxID=2294117 RepID=A0A372EHA8_9BURK|nr:ChaN family lipoprotein [Hydrogenophaga borbori]RFP77842.1 hypothetical protein DY262_13895 [Hydrogenophaga borbori]